MYFLNKYGTMLNSKYNFKQRFNVHTFIVSKSKTGRTGGSTFLFLCLKFMFKRVTSFKIVLGYSSLLVYISPIIHTNPHSTYNFKQRFEQLEVIELTKHVTYIWLFYFPFSFFFLSKRKMVTHLKCYSNIRCCWCICHNIINMARSCTAHNYFQQQLLRAQSGLFKEFTTTLG